MTQQETRLRQSTLFGGIQVFLAEGIAIPTGILTVAYLTRQLGPSGYGLYALVTAIVVWLEWSATSLFSRATIKFVSESQDWKAVGAATTRMHFLASLVCMAFLFLLASPIARFAQEPRLANLLRLCSIDIPLFGLALAHRQILIGLGAFRERAIAGAGRWISRLAFIVLFVHLGWSIPGAILGTIAASIVDLAITRFYVRPSLLAPIRYPTRTLWEYAVPLSLNAMIMRLFDKLDLFLLKGLGASIAETGIYASAQNLAQLPNLFAASFAPLLLARLSALIGSNMRDEARRLVRDSLRSVFLLLPFIAAVSGASTEISTLIFGAPFASAGPLLALLVLGSLAVAMIVVNSCVLTASAKPNWALAAATPLVPFAAIGYWIFIPRSGSMGAATVTTIIAAVGAIVSGILVYRIWKVFANTATILKSAALTALAFVASIYWHTPGAMVIVKMSLIGAILLAALYLLGELRATEANSISE